MKIQAISCLLMVTLGAGCTALRAQSATASDADKQFLSDMAKDSNFEMATSRLALAKGKSQDVKRYATMVLHDHEQLQRQTRSADRVAGVPVVAPSSMTEEEQSEYDKLKGLSGDEFEKTYIQELIKGNDQIEKEEKAESSESQLPPVKALAQKASQIDAKHAEAAKQLATAHGITG